MTISTKDWVNYINKLAAINKKAADLMREYVQKNGFANTDELMGYAHAVATKYGEAAAELTCQMYEATAEAQGVIVRAAEPADTPTFAEVAKAVNGTIGSPETMCNAIGRLTKRTGADTMLKNASRDNAEFAWVPHGDTCPFCTIIASRGWQRISEKALKNGHAEHIHANCDCQYAVRFDKKSSVEGYDPEKLKFVYDNMPGKSSEEKKNALRRAMTGKNALTIDQLEIIIRIEETPKILGKKTEKEWKVFFEELGFETKPLSRGEFKGVEFEDGGGYKINYRGDGYIQYHPEGHHHNGKYYKTSSAKYGIRRFEMDGSIKND